MTDFPCRRTWSSLETGIRTVSFTRLPEPCSKDLTDLDLGCQCYGWVEA